MDENSRTPYGRLIILMPPGSAKSTYASVVFPSRYLGELTQPRRIIMASYGADLARKMGRRTRSIIKQPRYRQILGVELSQESSAADQFALSNGSEYMSSGLLGGVTGNRANGAIIDDPTSGREDASSATMQDKTWDAYSSDLLTRLVPGGWLTMIMTRWDENDLGGRVLPDGWDGESGVFTGKDGMEWRVLCLQAKCETHTDPLGRKLGEYLWPEWFGAQHWAQFERNARDWNSLFQQRPRPPEGSFFLESSLMVEGRPVEMPQRIDAVFAIIDTAIKTGKGHDGTGVVYAALCRTGIAHPLTILDWDYVQIEGGSLEHWLPSVFDRLEALAAECLARRGSAGAFIEDKGSGMVLLQQAASRGWPAQAIDSKLSSMGKTERAMNASPHVSAGDVKITRHAYEKVVTFKGSTKNHLLSQVLGFSMDSKDGAADDLTDCFDYAVAIALGNTDGF